MFWAVTVQISGARHVSCETYMVENRRQEQAEQEVLKAAGRGNAKVMYTRQVSDLERGPVMVASWVELSCLPGKHPGRCG